MPQGANSLYVIIGVLSFIIIFIAFRTLRKRRYAEPELIDEMEGHDFEVYCADLLQKNGFYDVEITKGSGDFGLDILAERDGVTYGIQCKRYDKPIGVSAIQQAYAGRDYYGRMVGAVMTNQYFTDAATKMALGLNILLWDRSFLEDLEDHV